MKALALANQQGQKIYTITQANLNETLPKIQATSLVKGDIISAVNAGQSVTVHERPVAISGWSGTGYMIIDAQTGSRVTFPFSNPFKSRAYATRANVILNFSIL